MADELLMTFDPPIMFGGEKMDSLLLREPTAGQLEKGGKLSPGETLASTTAFQIDLIVAVSGKTRQFVSQMKVSDLRKATAFLMDFITGSQMIGETS